MTREEIATSGYALLAMTREEIIASQAAFSRLLLIMTVWCVIARK